MMNPGPVEEGAKVAGSVVDALRNQPILLGLLIIIAALVGLLFFVGYKSADTRQRELDKFYESQKETQKLLANCITIDAETLLRLQKGEPLHGDAKPKGD